MAESKITIVPLTGANYATWKIQCEISLLKDGLREIVDGSEAASAEADGAYSKYISQKNFALAIIVLSIDLFMYLVIPLIQLQSGRGSLPSFKRRHGQTN